MKDIANHLSTNHAPLDFLSGSCLWQSFFMKMSGYFSYLYLDYLIVNIIEQKELKNKIK